MLAFEVGGTPRTTLLGTDESSLTWLVDHPVGTQLMLSVVDTNGNAGGIPPSLYQVVTGQSTTCVQNAQDTGFTVRANVTDTISTCQPWGLRIHGGVPPYNITFSALNSPNVTNVTMLGIDDGFTYIDRASPGTQLLAAVSDLTGKWATGTPIVSTQGSNDTTCLGLNSSDGNATELDQQDAAAAAEAAQHSRTNTILAAVFGTLGGLLLVAGAIGAFIYFRRRAEKREEISEMEIAKPFDAHSAQEGRVLSINSWVNNGPEVSERASKLSAPLSDAPFNPYLEVSTNTENSSRPSSSGRPGFTNFPVRNGKTAELVLRPGHTPTNSSSALLDWRANGEEGGAVQEYVIQHRDAGGAVVRELPPPYLDRATAPVVAGTSNKT